MPVNSEKKSLLVWIWITNNSKNIYSLSASSPYAVKIVIIS